MTLAYAVSGATGRTKSWFYEFHGYARVRRPVGVNNVCAMCQLVAQLRQYIDQCFDIAADYRHREAEFMRNPNAFFPSRLYVGKTVIRNKLVLPLASRRVASSTRILQLHDQILHGRKVTSDLLRDAFVQNQGLSNGVQIRNG